jgi:putative membrane protein
LTYPAHDGQPPAPHDVWQAWNLDPLIVGGLLVAVWAYLRGQSRRPSRERHRLQARCFLGAMAVLSVALVSPLDALSSALASAHMVQHVLLVLVVAPLLALSAPTETLLSAGPPHFGRDVARWRMRLGLSRAHLRVFRSPGTVWLLHVAALWFWHAAGPYDAAVRNELLHVLEHISFLVTGVMFWGVIIGRRAAGRVWNGLGVLLVFAMAMQSTFLALLLTFAPTPWYSVYANTTAPWHLEPLADQQLAGAIMWVPAGLVYLGAGLFLTVSWVRASEREAAEVMGAQNVSKQVLEYNPSTKCGSRETPDSLLQRVQSKISRSRSPR